jgi:hypothetical protein
MPNYEKYTVRDYILGLGRLYEYSSNLRFQLLDPISIEDKYGKIARDIDLTIQTEFGFSVFEAKNESDLLEYENVLNNLSIKHAKETIPIADVSDEIDFLKTCEEYSADRFKNIEIIINKDERYWKSAYELVRSKLKIDYHDILAYSRSLEYINVSKFEGVNFFLGTTLITRNKKEFIFFSIYRGSEGDVIQTPTSYKIDMTSTGKPITKAYFYAVFLVSYDKFSQYLKKPSNLFLRLIADYGIYTTINGVTKKMHKDVYFPDLDFESVQKKTRNAIDDVTSGVAQPFVLSLYRPLRFGYKISFLTLINYSAYAKDYSNFRL